MPVSNHLTRTVKYKGRIVTSDPLTQRIEVVFGDGAVRQISPYNIPRWPIEGEIWTVYQENQDWMLGFRWEAADDEFPSSSLEPGDMKLDSSTIYDVEGNRVVATPPPNDGDSIVWIESNGAWVAQKIGAANIDSSLIFNPGDIKATTRSVALAGWLLALGQNTLLRADYPALWVLAQAEIALGNALYNVGNGTTTFGIANLQGRVPIGAGTATGARGATAHTLGQALGEETHGLTTPEIPAHAHGNNSGGTGGFVTAALGGAGVWVVLGSGASLGIQDPTSAASLTTASAGGGGDHNNMQPSVTINYMIKT